MRKRLYFFITICWLAAMGTMLFYPYDYVPVVVEKFTLYDKVAHMIMFGVLTYLILAILIRWDKFKFFLTSVVAISISVIANIGAEFIQSYIPGRDPSYLDFLAGLIGTVLAIPVAYLVYYSFRPKTVLHVCCAPCATSVSEILKKNHRLEFFYSNPNIYPSEEYYKRLKEVKKLAAVFGIKVVEDKYDHENWKKSVSGFEKDLEGQTRCDLCFLHRLKSAGKHAKKRKASFFATTLTVSPHKNSFSINKIGEGVSDMAGVEFLNYDFKKDGGFSRSVELSKKFNFYRQKYCGCEFSIRKKEK